MEANLANPATSLMVVGLNHHATPVELREQFVFSDDALDGALARLVDTETIREGAILSTCNRVEIIARTPNLDTANEKIRNFLAAEKQVTRSHFEDYLYTHVNRDAVRHLFRVASSLDSLVVGEPQILGQMKDAYAASSSLGTLGTVLHRCFHKSFSVAKRVRTETAIAAKAVSVSSAAIDLACAVFDRLEDKTAMVIGVGEMGEQAVRHLRGRGVGTILVTNRTFRRAVELARTCNGTVVPFDQLEKHLHLADVVIGSAGSPHYLLHSGMIEDALRERKRSPMFLIDLGVPRNFDPRLNGLDNVFLYDIDDLEQVVEDNKGERQLEAVKAEAIIAEEVESFWRWFSNLEVTPTIVALREQAELVRQREVEKTLATLKELPPQVKEGVEALSRSITNKLLHPPLAYLKRRNRQTRTEPGRSVRAPAQQNGHTEQTEQAGEIVSAHAFRQIFGLDEDED